MDELEVKVHGRQRDLSTMAWSSSAANNNDKNAMDMADEARFGVLQQPMLLAKGIQVPDAQWTGVVTGIALSMLESKMVDAVVCIASASSSKDDESKSWSYPEPILARTPEDVLKGRGVKPALAPSLRVLDEIRKDSSIKKLLFCGVGCAVQGELIECTAVLVTVVCNTMPSNAIAILTLKMSMKLRFLSKSLLQPFVPFKMI